MRYRDDTLNKNKMQRTDRQGKRALCAAIAMVSAPLLFGGSQGLAQSATPLVGVEVRGQYMSGPEAPGRWRWDTTSYDWDWVPDDYSQAAIIPDVPSTREACAAAEEVWSANNCDANYAPQSVNGCGTSGVAGMVIPDSFEHISFSSACNNHDACYGTIGADRSTCDGRISADITAACLDGRVHWSGFCQDTPIAGLTFSECRQEMHYQCTGRASIYQGAVANYGLEPFQAAQRSAVCRAPRGVIEMYDCNRP